MPLTCVEKGSDSRSIHASTSRRGTSKSGPIFTDVAELGLCSNIESALGVPTRILFRRIGGDQSEPKRGASRNNIHYRGKRKKQEKEYGRCLRPLLSRQEVEQFLCLTLVAQEIDVLVDLSEMVLSRRRFARVFHRDVLMQRDPTSPPTEKRLWKNPWLSTLGPILDVLEHQRTHPSMLLLKNRERNEEKDDGQLELTQDSILKHIHNELTRLYYELKTCGIYELERSAEQNRSLVTSLTDILDYHCDADTQDFRKNNDGNKSFAVWDLAREKLSLSKLQNLIAKRVRSLLMVLCHSHVKTLTQANDSCDGVGRLDDCVNYNDRIEKGRRRILFYDDSPSTSVDAMTKDIGNDEKLPARRYDSYENADDDNDASGDDEHSVLSLEEILVPLEVVCEELFARNDRNASTESMATTVQIEKDNEHSQNVRDKPKSKTSFEAFKPNQKQKLKRRDQSTNKSPTAKQFTPPGSALESSHTMKMVTIETSQRTAMVVDFMMELTKTTGQHASVYKKKIPKIDRSVKDDSEPLTMDIALASQRTFGATSAMMTLAAKAGKAITTTTNKQEMAIIGETSRNSELPVSDRSNRNAPRTQQHADNSDHDNDSSSVDDLRDNKKDVRNKIPQKDKSACFNGIVKNNDVGIFDVVDALTPQSQIVVQEQSSQ